MTRFPPARRSRRRFAPALRCGFPALRRGFCGLLSLLTALLCAAPAAALPGDPAPATDGVAPVYDEAYYATTDYYGNLTEGSVVKSYVRNGADSITDAGQYDQVINLTDGTDPDTSQGTITFHFAPDAPSHFYFEGRTAAPFRALPWRVSVRYTLNGVAARAEDLAGKTGVVEIIVDAVPNPEASEYARNNYVLACNAIFNQEDILSLEAPGAQLQLIGNLRAALFLALPGEEQQFVMRVGAEAFSFGGLTIMLMPATLSQLEEIAKLSEKKNDLEDSYHKLSDSLDTMLDAFREMQDSLYETADGLDALDKARQTVSSGKDSVYSELDRMQGDLSKIASALDPVAGLAGDTSRSLTETKARANTLVDAALGLQEDLAEAEAALGALGEDLLGLEGSLERLEEDLGDIEASLDSGEAILGDLDGNLESLGDDLDALGSRLNSLDGTLKQLEGRMAEAEEDIEELEGNDGSVRRVLDSAASLKTSLNRLRSALSSVKIPAYSSGGSRSGNLAKVVEAGEELEKKYQSLEKLYALTATQGAQEAAFFTAMLTQQGKSQEEAAQIAAVLSTNDADMIAAADPTGGLAAAYRQLYGLYAMQSLSDFLCALLTSQGYHIEEETQISSFVEFFQAVLISQGYSKSDAEQAARLWRIYENNDRNLATLELLMDTADDVEGDIGTATSKAAAALNSISGPAATVLGDLSGLCGNLDSLEPMLDDAADLSETLRDTLDTLADLSKSLRAVSGTLQTTTDTLQETVEIGEEAVETGLDGLENAKKASEGLRELSGAVRGASGTARSLLDLLAGTTVKAREILEDTDTLRVTLNGFEPTAQKSLKVLGTLSDQAAAAVRDLNRTVTAVENVSKPAGRQLDQGAKQSLDGLSSTLRTAADGLDTTTDLQAAKDAVTALIEDTWDEYTGDMNNLLLMDAAAEAQSLTSAKNPAPQSVQVLIRTQEIKADDEDESGGGSGGSGGGNSVKTAQDSGKPTTFLGRVRQMFRDLWDGLTGLFR